MPLSQVAASDDQGSDVDWLNGTVDGWHGPVDHSHWGGDEQYGNKTRNRWQSLNDYQFQDPGLDPNQKAQLERAQAQNAEARQQQMQMMSLAQNWANGGVTPQQQQMQQGFETQRIGTNAVANAAIGGARGSIAARQNAGMQTAQDAQFNDLSMQQQKAKDQQLGQQMMMQAANQMREQDIGSLHAANAYASQNAQSRLGWQGMNDKNRLFYGNMLDNQKLAMSGIQLENAEQDQQLALQADARKSAAIKGGLGAAAGAAAYGAKWASSGDDNNEGQ